jgi:hypothetical protein
MCGPQSRTLHPPLAPPRPFVPSPLLRLKDRRRVVDEGDGGGVFELAFDTDGVEADARAAQGADGLQRAAGGEVAGGDVRQSAKADAGFGAIGHQRHVFELADETRTDAFVAEPRVELPPEPGI